MLRNIEDIFKNIMLKYGNKSSDSKGEKCLKTQD